MSVMSVYLTLFNEAKAQFGEPSTWNSYEVGAWMKARMEALRGGETLVEKPYQPRNFVDVEPVGRWDDCEDL